MTLTLIKAVLQRHRYNFIDEAQFQRGVAAALTNAGIAFTREAKLDEHDRIDFLIGTVGVEVKIKGSLTNLTRQLFRYAKHDAIEALVVVTSQNRLSALPLTILGKPCEVLTFSRAF